MRSHAVGMGEPLTRETVRAAMVIRLNTMARGHSGVRAECAEMVAAMLNADLVPWVPSRGSLGASGDLAPSAHLVLAMMGEGELLTEDGPARAERACAAGRRARASRARGQRGPQPAERHPVHGRHRLPRGGRRRGAPGLRRPHRRDEPGGPARLRRPLPGAHPGAAAHPRPAHDGPPGARRHRGQRDHAQPPQLRQGAGRLLAALHPAGARRLPRRPALAARGRLRGGRRRHRQPARLPRERRDHLGRQLPRRAARPGARPGGDGRQRDRQHQRAPHLPHADQLAVASCRRSSPPTAG